MEIANEIVKSGKQITYRQVSPSIVAANLSQSDFRSPFSTQTSPA